MTVEPECVVLHLPEGTRQVLIRRHHDVIEDPVVYGGRWTIDVREGAAGTWVPIQMTEGVVRVEA